MSVVVVLLLGAASASDTAFAGPAKKGIGVPDKAARARGGTRTKASSARPRSAAAPTSLQATRAKGPGGRATAATKPNGETLYARTYDDGSIVYAGPGNRLGEVTAVPGDRFHKHLTVRAFSWTARLPGSSVAFSFTAQTRAEAQKVAGQKALRWASANGSLGGTIPTPTLEAGESRLVKVLVSPAYSWEK